MATVFWVFCAAFLFQVCPVIVLVLGFPRAIDLCGSDSLVLSPVCVCVSMLAQIFRFKLVQAESERVSGSQDVSWAAVFVCFVCCSVGHYFKVRPTLAPAVVRTATLYLSSARRPTEGGTDAQGRAGLKHVRC